MVLLLTSVGGIPEKCMSTTGQTVSLSVSINLWRQHFNFNLSIYKTNTFLTASNVVCVNLQKVDAKL